MGIYRGLIIFEEMYKSLIFTVLLAISSLVHANNTDTRSDSIDILHTDLHLDVSNFASHILYGHADITFSPRVNGVNYIQLDLLRLIVDSVKWNGNAVSYSYNDTLVSISLPVALAAGAARSISIYYHGTPIQPPGDFGGFYWDNLYAFNIGVSFLSHPHNYGKVWFPCFDNFVERSSYHFAITTDSTRRALCNGRQDSMVINPSHSRTWYWSMDTQIPSYLASMSVSDYSVITDSYVALNGILPIMLAARAADTTKLRNSFAHLKNAISIFENRFGPYEFNRVGYCVVPFTAGAMEHATNISYMRDIVDGTTNYENYMAHELSHHWFGDLATCDSEGEMWLNEGWANYCEDIFYEGLYGKDKYKRDVRIKHEDVIRMAHIEDGAYWPLSGMPSNLTYSNYSVYEKGGDRAHTLRGYMGDSLFFTSVKKYLQHYKFQDVNSVKMRDYLVSSSGLTRVNDFFADWVFDGGFPDFAIEDKKIVPIGGLYSVGLSIRQRSDHTSHLFNNVPLEVAYFDSMGNKTVQVANVSGGCTQFFATLPFAPAYIALDFDEKLSDAVTDQWYKVAGASGSFDFGVAKMTMNLIQSSDSSLVRIEHHWVAPDASFNTIPGLHLSDRRYWNVDGIWSTDFWASAVINYNGTTNSQGYLDNSFISNSEDSLVLVYRPDAKSPWQINTDVAINTGGNTNDKLGTITINTLQKGQYALAIYDANKVDSPQSSSGCYALGVREEENQKTGFKAYPNPVNSQELNVEMDANSNFTKCMMVNILGETVVAMPVAEGQNKFTINMKGLARGSYVLSLINRDNKRISKKIQN